MIVVMNLAVYYGLTLFRYRSPDNFYDSGKIADLTNWWKWADYIRLYGGLSISGILSITSMLAYFGVLELLNAELWMWLGITAMVMELTISVMRIIGYESAYSESQQTVNMITSAMGINLMATIQRDVAYDMIITTATLIALAGAQDGFFYSVWQASSSEEQEEMMKTFDEIIETRAKEMQVSNEEGAQQKVEEETEDNGDEEETEE